MNTWGKIDILSTVLFIFSVVCIFCSTYHVLTMGVCIVTITVMLHKLYQAKYENYKYNEMLCHYQAILASATDGWIIWNCKNECIGASKNLKTFFALNKAEASISDILGCIDKNDSKIICDKFAALKKTGKTFSETAFIQNTKNTIFINGSRVIVNGVESIVLWCSNVTDVSRLVHSLESKVEIKTKEASLYKDVINSIPIPIWTRNSNLEISFCNGFYADCLDATYEKVIMNNIPLIPGNLFGKGHSLAENAKKCKKPQNISQFAVIKGARKKLSVCESPIGDESFAGYAFDLTSEEDVAANLDRVVTANCEVLETLSTAIAIFGENTKLTFFNSAYQRLIKLDAGWLHAKPTFGEILDECRTNRQIPEHADYQGYKKTQLSLFTSITKPTQELMHLPNGKTHRLVIAPYPLGGLLFMYEDVTDSLALQRKNNTLLAVQKETIDHLYEGIAVFGSNNRLKIFNKSFQKIWNFENTPYEEINGIHITEFLDKIKTTIDFGDNWSEFRENSVSNLTDRIAKTGKLYKNDQSTILFSYIPLPDGAHMHSYIDITATCVVEQAITEKNLALKTAQKLRCEFVSCISTELKEPLNILIGFADLLKHQYYGTLNDKQLEYCHCMLSSAEQLQQLIANLVEMMSIDIEDIKLEITTFSLEEAIGDVLASISKRAQEKAVEIATQIDIDNIIFSGDRKRIKQCIFNMLINSVQITPPNETIHLIISYQNEQLKIVIKDGGTSTAKSKKKVFIRAHEKPNKQDANSPGIQLIRSIIELHGGTLTTTSEPNCNGSVIICSLPCQGPCPVDEFISINQEQRVVNL